MGSTAGLPEFKTWFCYSFIVETWASYSTSLFLIVPMEKSRKLPSSTCLLNPEGPGEGRGAGPDEPSSQPRRPDLHLSILQVTLDEHGARGHTVLRERTGCRGNKTYCEWPLSEFFPPLSHHPTFQKFGSLLLLFLGGFPNRSSVHSGWLLFPSLLGQPNPAAHVQSSPFLPDLQ